MRLQMTTMNDLRNWVWNHFDEYLSAEDIATIVAAIQRDPNRPNWGKDWAEYFADLPERLDELIGV